jgi:hypothetical protein
MGASKGGTDRRKVKCLRVIAAPEPKIGSGDWIMPLPSLVGAR